ncbi:MAG: MaoC/PaaZ C-terminal domain-containing protein [Desulfovibrionaceae bacterium]
MPETGTAERIFRMEDQRRFAALSGDANPLHLDPLAARRSLAGGVAVHGIHTLLWALEAAIAGDGPFGLEALDARFRRPLGLEVPARVRWTRRGEALELEVAVGDGPVLTVTAHTGPVRQTPRPAGPPPAEPCRELDRAALAAEPGGTLPLGLDPGLSAVCFPGLARTLEPAQLALLLGVSRLVGMRCPGLHSLLSRLDLARPEAGGGAASFGLELFDERFSLAILAVRAPGLSGRVHAFLRPAPVGQLDFARARELTVPGEFAGLRALVVGGSRGLGEATVKLLAAGGADVRGTYRSGSGEAAALEEEIVRGGGRVAFSQLDVLDPRPGLDGLLADGWAPTDLAYYATPRIFVGRGDRFDPALFARFVGVYVGGLAALLEGLAPDRLPSRVLYPSSVAVADPPPDMGEYAAAKAAGEVMCAHLGKALPGVRFLCPRFPRLDTDQTASLYPVENRDPAPAVLEALRALLRGTSPAIRA